MDGTQEYYQYLIPRVDQNNNPDVKEGYLASVVCAEVWNDETGPIEYPADGARGDVFVFRANKTKSVEFGDLVYYSRSYYDYWEDTFYKQYSEVE